MNLESKLDRIHLEVKSNKWFRYFAVFDRILLAAGFIPLGLTKVFGERFTSVSVNHPMGNYLEALYQTGNYYPFIGYVQVIAAILLLIPRTATIGALIYFPIILNISILSLSVGFDGSLFTSPLMVLANLYLLFWDYDKLKFIMPFASVNSKLNTKIPESREHKFPVKFFLGAGIAVALTILFMPNSYDKKSRNTLSDCLNDCKDNDNAQSCIDFCNCIHNQGPSFNKCSEEFRKAKSRNID